MSSVSLSTLHFRGVEKKLFSDYHTFLTAKKKTDIARLAGDLRGKHVIHVNTAPHGGGVAELLKSVVSLENNVGMRSEWWTIDAPPEFFVVTKKIHNALQSAPLSLTKEEKNLYLEVNKRIADDLRALERADVYVMHDPQPLAAVSYFHEGEMVSRMHIDLSGPNQGALSFLKPYIKQYDCLVFSMEEFAIPGIRTKNEYILPAIDPLSPKNRHIDKKICRDMLRDFGIHPERPLVSQISRFDPWKDPLGVIQAYYHAKNEIPGLQLALVGFAEAQDDPEAYEVFERVKKYAKGDPDIFIFFDLDVLGEVRNELFVNAVQTVSDAVLQKSLKEGFGLTVTEAMWKGNAVVAGNVGGIRKQIRDGKDGFLVESALEAAEKIVAIIRDEALKKRLGKSAQARVRDNFLITRHLHDHLRLYTKALHLN